MAGKVNAEVINSNWKIIREDLVISITTLLEICKTKIYSWPSKMNN